MLFPSITGYYASIAVDLETHAVLVLPQNPVDIQASRSKINVTDAAFRFHLIYGLKGVRWADVLLAEHRRASLSNAFPTQFDWVIDWLGHKVKGEGHAEFRSLFWHFYLYRLCTAAPPLPIILCNVSSHSCLLERWRWTLLLLTAWEGTMATMTLIGYSGFMLMLGTSGLAGDQA